MNLADIDFQNSGSFLNRGAGADRQRDSAMEYPLYGSCDPASTITRNERTP